MPKGHHWNEENDMRKKLVESDLVECVLGIGKNLFFNSPMEACIVICRTNKPANRRGRVLFINAKNEVTRKNAQSYLADEHISKIATTYSEFSEIEGFSAIATIRDIAANDHKLSIPLYVRGSEEPEPELISLEDAVAEWLEESATVRENYNLLNELLNGGATDAAV